MDLADPELEISAESVLHRIRRKGFFFSLINVHRMRYRLGTGTNALRSDRKNCFYLIFVKTDGKLYTFVMRVLLWQQPQRNAGF